jgi:hypothetical protein
MDEIKIDIYKETNFEKLFQYYLDSIEEYEFKEHKNPYII